MTVGPLPSSDRSTHLRIVSLPQTFQSKALIPAQPDALWRIDSGVVRTLTWEEDGQVITLGFWGKGDVVGQPLSRKTPYQMECLTPVQVHELQSAEDYLQHALLLHAWRSEKLLSILHQSSVTERLQQLLEWLADQFGYPTPYGTLLKLALTHQDFADTIGATRVTITRLFKRLEKAGQLERFANGQTVRKYPQFGKLPRQSLLLKLL